MKMDAREIRSTSFFAGALALALVWTLVLSPANASEKVAADKLVIGSMTMKAEGSGGVMIKGINFIDNRGDPSTPTIQLLGKVRAKYDLTAEQAGEILQRVAAFQDVEDRRLSIRGDMSSLGIAGDMIMVNMSLVRFERDIDKEFNLRSITLQHSNDELDPDVSALFTTLVKYLDPSMAPGDTTSSGQDGSTTTASDNSADEDAKPTGGNNPFEATKSRLDDL